MDDDLKEIIAWAAIAITLAIVWSVILGMLIDHVSELAVLWALTPAAWAVWHLWIKKGKKDD